MCRPFLLVVSLLTLLALQGGLAGADQKTERVPRQKTESFDKDPGWDGHNNRVKVEKPISVVQDFGYSNTNHAGGKAVGEMGGRIQRSTTPAFYGKKLAKPRTLNQKLHCSGTFAVTQTTGMTSLYFGWFNTRTMEVRPRNWMGMYINGEAKGCEISFGYNTATGRSDGIRATGVGPWGAAVRDFNQIPTGTPYTFDFLYDPQANGGHGQITFTLGGKGPFTGGPFTFKLPPAHRKAGATFNAFGIINQQSAGNGLTIYFDDLLIDGERESFERDPKWLGQGNRARHEDSLLEGAHQFGFSTTRFAGGKPGEMGGLLFSSDRVPGYYADRVGQLTLDDRLVASGKLAMKVYGHDGGLYLGWFDSRKRGWPPANILGVLIDGTSSAGPRLRGCVASADPKLAHCQWETAPPISTDGASRTWKIDYDPGAEDGRGRLTVWLDDRKDSFTLPVGLRKRGARFDRFGLFVHENGGRVSRIYFDDLEYTTASGEMDSSIRTLEGHTGSVLGVTFSPDGKILASCCRDKTIKLWDPQTGQLLRTLTEHTGDVYDVVYSPRGDLLASGGKDRVIRLWDARTGKVIRTLEGHDDIVRSVAFSPDHKTLASGSVDLTVRLWDVATGKLKRTLKGHTARVMSVVYSPDGRLLASASSDSTARLWDARSGEVIRVLKGHDSGLECIDFSPDGKLLASSSHDTTVRIWNVATGASLHTLKGHTSEVDSVSFSPDGKTVASGCKDKTLKLWDARTGKLLRTLTGHTGRVESLAFSPDGKTLATGGGGGDTAVKLWDLTKE